MDVYKILGSCEKRESKSKNRSLPRNASPVS